MAECVVQRQREWRRDANSPKRNPRQAWLKQTISSSIAWRCQQPSSTHLRSMRWAFPLHGEGMTLQAQRLVQEGSRQSHPGAMVSLMWMEGRIVEDEEGKPVEDLDAQAVALTWSCTQELAGPVQPWLLDDEGAWDVKSALKALELFEQAAPGGMRRHACGAREPRAPPTTGVRWRRRLAIPP